MKKTNPSPHPVSRGSPAPTGHDVPLAVVWRPVAVDAEGLMPLEAAAKALFVKANGLPAYYRATRSARSAE